MLAHPTVSLAAWIGTPHVPPGRNNLQFFKQIFIRNCLNTMWWKFSQFLSGMFLYIMCYSSNLNWGVMSRVFLQNCDVPIANNGTRQGMVLQELSGEKSSQFISNWSIYCSEKTTNCCQDFKMWNTPSVYRYHDLKSRLDPLFPILVPVPSLPFIL